MNGFQQIPELTSSYEEQPKNINYMLAGSARTNPGLFTVAILLVLAWKIAGYYRVDRFPLPALGTPWKPRQGVHPQPRGSVTAVC